MKFTTILQALAIAVAAVQEVSMSQDHAIQNASDAVTVSAISDTVSTYDASAEVSELAEEFSSDILIGNVPSRLMDLMRSTEKYSGSMYFDERGAKAVGYGRNIDKARNGGISLEEAKWLMMQHVAHFEKLLTANAPWTKSLDNVRRGALLNMSFQMGVGSASRGTGVLGFRTAMAQIKNGNYAAASRSLGNSIWAKQTPNRARRIAKQIETGQWIVDGRRTPLPGGLEANLFEQLRVDEGYRPYAYKCSMNYWTFGIGILIDSKKGGKIRKEEAEYLLRSGLDTIRMQWAKSHSWFSRMSEARQSGLVAFSYKASYEAVSGFKGAMAAFAAGNFRTAAAELMNSGFGRQAAAKARTFTRMIETGAYPTTFASEQEFASELEEEDWALPVIEMASEEDEHLELRF